MFKTNKLLHFLVDTVVGKIIFYLVAVCFGVSAWVVLYTIIIGLLNFIIK